MTSREFPLIGLELDATSAHASETEPLTIHPDLVIFNDRDEAYFRDEAVRVLSDYQGLFRTIRGRWAV